MTQPVAASVNTGLHRILPLAATLPLPRLVAELNRFRPDFVNAYPSIAALLSEEQLAGRLRIRLERMSTSSEPLTPEVRQRIEAAFGVQPFNLYGTTEGLWGCECEEHAGIHLFDDVCVVENVDEDGRPVPVGEPGARLLPTNLFNRAQPLIRFELTDLATVETDACRCGRTLLRLRSLTGRSADVIRLAGVTVHPMHFGLITTDPDVHEFQVVQDGERLTLRVVLGSGASEAPTRLRSPTGKLQTVVADRTAARQGEPHRPVECS